MPHLPDDARAKQLETLRRAHEKLDRQVQEMESQRWLSPVEEKEMKRLKRLKLAKKDRMQQLHAEA